MTQLSVFRPALVFITLLFVLTGTWTSAQNSGKMKKKILFVVTSHDQKGNTGEPTGFYLSEVSHPWKILVQAGYEIDFVSPRGGKAPVDGFNLGDAENKEFWNNPFYRRKVENTLKPSQVEPEQYAAIHYAGGHGAMWDFADNVELAQIAAKIYEGGGVVSAVCHGPAGLVNIKLSNGDFLVAGKKINAFTNEEETAVKLDTVVPFLLASKLIKRGAIFEKSGLWQSHVVSDQRVVTGQNPQSAKAVGKAILEALNQQQVVARLTRYEVKKTYLDKARQLLNNYVQHAISSESNIMAEAYYEQESPSVLWLMERWTNKNELQKFSGSKVAKMQRSLSEKALEKPVKTIYVKDLEPISKQQWRATANKEDSQLTIMLFVDTKPGTQDHFKEVYHTAMPQFRNEPGVVTYQLSQVDEDSTQFVTYEKFKSNDAFQYHLNFPPIQPVIDFLNTSIKKQPFQQGLHQLVAFAPLTRQ